LGTVRLRYLKVYRARGKPVAYYRRAGINRRLCGPDGSPVDPADAAALTTAWNGAHAAWEAAEQAAALAGAARSIAPRTMADLIAHYRADDFQRLAPATRRDYEKALRPLEDLYGDLQVATLQPHHVRRIQRRHATRTEPVPGEPGRTVEVPNVRQANRIVTVLGILMSYARGVLGWRSDNPAARPRRLRSDGEGYTPWTQEMVDQFLACADVHDALKRAVALGWYTALRKADCLVVTRSARRGGWITVTPSKTKRTSGATRDIPEHPDLTRWLDSAPPSDAVTLLTRPDGRPWRIDHFNHEIAVAIRAAGLDGVSFHGLRKGRLADLAQRGATDAELDAIAPHADPRMRAHYRRSADARVLALRAIERPK
jgi:integrase